MSRAIDAETVSLLGDKLGLWLASKENESLEFKEAKTSFEFEDLVKYCAALANEGGGSIVLGVSDKIPRKVVGSQAFKEARSDQGWTDRPPATAY